MWVTFLSTAIVWSQLSPGSLWMNPSLISCSGASFAYNAVSSTTQVLVGDTSGWSHNDLFIQGYFELSIWAADLSAVTFDYFEVDGIKHNITGYLNNVETVIKVDHNMSLPSNIRLKLKTNKQTMILFSCLKFHGEFIKTTTGSTSTLGSTTTTTTTTSSSSSSLTTSSFMSTLGSTLTSTSTSIITTTGILLESQEETQHSESYWEMSFIVVYLLFFLSYWLFPISKSREWSLNLTSIQKQDTYILAKTYYKGEYFDVAGYLKKDEVHLSTFFGHEFCPYLGEYDCRYHVYAIGQRIPLSAAIQGASFHTRLTWLLTLSNALTKSHKVNQSLGLLENLWIDPVTQKLSIANYYQNLDQPKGVDINQLGKIASQLTEDCRDDDDLTQFIHHCLSAKPPSAKECFKKLSYFISLQ